MASNGYPQKYETGFEITIPEGLDAEAYVAGGKLSDDGKLLTSGGRVLGVSAVGDGLANAIEKAYAAVKQIHFENAYSRSDIGAKALAALKQEA